HDRLDFLFLLTLTSTQAAQRKMGKRWQTLHNYVYLAAILLPLHYIWSVKVLSPLPIIYAICFVVLLAFRYKKLLRKTRYKGVFMKSE
ncbi:sulfoxide reductase heme-binding subunit YedZ, partial [Citrobacter freundii]